MREIAFDDIDQLRAEIRDDFGEWSSPLTVTQAMIDNFAELTNDRQWIHTDVERAKSESPFGTTIAHGFLILSLMPALRPPASFKIVNHRSAANKGSSGLKFISAVPSGGELQVRERVAGVEEHRLGTLVSTDVEFGQVGSSKPALLYNVQVLYMA